MRGRGVILLVGGRTSRGSKGVVGHGGWEGWLEVVRGSAAGGVARGGGGGHGVSGLLLRGRAEVVATVREKEGKHNE